MYHIRAISNDRSFRFTETNIESLIVAKCAAIRKFDNDKHKAMYVLLDDRYSRRNIRFILQRVK